MTDNITFEDCYARWTDATLTIGNRAIERTWSISESGRIEARSLIDRQARAEWVAGPIGASPAVSVHSDTNRPSVHIKALTARASCVSSAALVVRIALAFETGEETYSFTVFPGLPAILVSASTQAASRVDASVPAADAQHTTGVETDPERAANEDERDVIDAFEPAFRQIRLRHITFVDRTDAHNEIVHEAIYRLHPSEKALALSGNLFVLEDVFRGNGIAFLKLAPLPWARPRQDAADLTVNRHLKFRFRGFGMDTDGSGGYRCAVVAFGQGQPGLTAVLQRLMRAIRNYESGRDGVLLSNTWGDRSRDSRIGEAFIKEEIEAASRLGIDVVQIDDGWQRGTTANSVVAGGVWENFNADASFWSVHPDRLPNGLTPLVEAARSRGIRLGLWFAPDSSEDFRNWRRDADTLLGLHRSESIDYFKLDGIEIRSKLGEVRLERMLDALREESGGKIVCDLDVTAQTRPGYFGAPEAGPVFLENRYTDWGNYWPHATLRNIWKLSRYLPPSQFRIEFLNNERNAEIYRGDVLAPCEYDPDYLFAITMPASPLAWFEVSQLSPRYSAAITPLIRVWRSIRERIHTGITYPVGEEPDGTAWTGFLMVPADGASSYLLAFRERTERTSHTFELGGLVDPSTAALLAGQGSALLDEGTLRVELPSQMSYALFELR